MYLTNFRVSALALLFSLTLIFGAAHFAPSSAEVCADCVDSTPLAPPRLRGADRNLHFQS